MVELLPGHTVAEIAHRYLDGLIINAAGLHVEPAILDVTVFHGISAVDEDVEEHLLEMDAIAAKRGEGGRSCGCSLTRRASISGAIEGGDLIDELLERRSARIPERTCQQRPHPVDDSASALIILADIYNDGTDLA